MLKLDIRQDSGLENLHGSQNALWVSTRRHGKPGLDLEKIQLYLEFKFVNMKFNVKVTTLRNFRKSLGKIDL